MYYHAHIYFHQNEVEFAKSLFRAAKDNLTSIGVRLGGFHEEPIGPHPTGMFELLFNDNLKNQTWDWLDKNRGKLNILIHENTGDDYRDHTDGAAWLGTKQELDFQFFEFIKKHPSFKIHKDN